MRTFRDPTGLNRLRMVRLRPTGESRQTLGSFRAFGEPGIHPPARQKSLVAWLDSDSVILTFDMCNLGMKSLILWGAVLLMC